MDELISVIIPVYNVECYLKECLDSVINQTYGNIEIIIVDDGSTDLSGKICDEYSVLDSRIRVIHKDNGGLSSARNVGIDLCSGNYITFLDSDDYMDESFCEKLRSVCLMNDSDISICSYNCVGDTISTSVNNNYYNCDDIELINPIEAIKRIDTTPGYISAWGKLYKRSIFDELRYPNGKFFEDQGTTYKAYYLANKIAVLKQPLYFYRIREGSISRSFRAIKRIDDVEMLMGKYDYIVKNDLNELIPYVLHSMTNAYSVSFGPFGTTSGEKIKKIRKIRHDCIKVLLRNVDSLSFGDYFKVLFPHLYLCYLTFRRSDMEF